MPQRLRFLLDTNVLIPLQDSLQVLEGNLANFVRLASIGGHLFITANAESQDYLIRVLMDFGFEERGTYRGDMALVKPHPVVQPPTAGANPIEYVRRYFPHYRSDSSVQKFLVPIQPRYHEILFPDYASIQPGLFAPIGNVGKPTHQGATRTRELDCFTSSR